MKLTMIRNGPKRTTSATGELELLQTLLLTYLLMNDFLVNLTSNNVYILIKMKINQK